MQSHGRPLKHDGGQMPSKNPPHQKVVVPPSDTPPARLDVRTRGPLDAPTDPAQRGNYDLYCPHCDALLRPGVRIELLAGYAFTCWKCQGFSAGVGNHRKPDARRKS